MKFAKIYLLRILLILGCLFPFYHRASAQCGDLILNEVDYDQPGTDQSEFVEVFGSPEADLSNLEIHFVNGLDGAVYRVQTLTGAMPEDGYLVLGSAIVPNLDALIGSGGSNLIQNGAPDGIGIWDLESQAYCDFISYEGTVVGFEGWPGIGTDPADLCGTGASASLAKPGETPSPTDVWVVGACASPGEPNLGPTPVGLAAFTLISTTKLGMIAGGIFALGAVELIWEFTRRHF